MEKLYINDNMFFKNTNYLKIYILHFKYQVIDQKRKSQLDT